MLHGLVEQRTNELMKTLKCETLNSLMKTLKFFPLPGLEPGSLG